AAAMTMTAAVLIMLSGSPFRAAAAPTIPADAASTTPATAAVQPVPTGAAPVLLDGGAHWESRVFLDEVPGGTAQEAVVSGRTKEESGRMVLSVGRWGAGAWSARLDSTTRMPFVRGTVRGRYRTVDLLPRQAEVRVTFWKGKEKLASASRRLATTNTWTE